jgi:hypothetical protein
VLQFKPGLLMTDAEAAEVLTRVAAAVDGLLDSGLLGSPELEARLGLLRGGDGRR